MDWMELLAQIFEVCVLPLLGVLTAFLVKFLQAKTKEFLAKQDNELLTKYVSMLSETVISCVIATNQTYVETLKKDGKFDAEAQKHALEMTQKAVLDILGNDAKEYLSTAYGDLDAFIMNMIEQQVKLNK